jgi:hypothetical protein
MLGFHSCSEEGNITILLHLSVNFFCFQNANRQLRVSHISDVPLIHFKGMALVFMIHKSWQAASIVLRIQLLNISGWKVAEGMGKKAIDSSV